jgi:hypothetical protein
MVAGPHYIALAQTAQKTPLSRDLPLLQDVTIGMDCIENAASIIAC